MSLILDALKRAESERESIRQSAALPAAASAPVLARPRRTWVFGVVAVAVILAVAFKLLRPPVTPPSETETEVVQDEPDVTDESGEPETIVDDDVTPIPGSEDIASLDDVSEPEEPQDSIAEPVVVAPAPAPAPTAAPAAEPTPPPAVVVQTPKTLKPLRDMPASYRGEFPALAIVVHSYDKDPALRFVRIGGYRYKEGEVLAEGPRLLEIVNNGLVLEYRGERVIYPLD